MYKKIQVIIALLTIALTAYIVITKNYGLSAFTTLLMAVFIGIYAVEAYNANKKGSALIYLIITLYILYASFATLF